MTGRIETLEEQDYYHGLLPREDLVQLLRNDGDFLIRLNETLPGRPRQIILSMMYDKRNPICQMKHFVIQKTARGTYRIEDKSFESVPALIRYQLNTRIPFNNDPKAIIKNGISHQNWELSHDDILVGKKIGESAEEEVRAGKLKTQTKRLIDVAVKIVKKKQTSGDKIKEMMKEARAIRNYDHPNIIRIFGIAVDREPFFVVVELVSGCSLYDYLQKLGSNTSIQEKLRNMSLGAALGVEYLHGQNCIHCDIAARNCLYTKNKVLKIGNFGLSRVGWLYKLKKITKLPVKWLAPETLKDAIYTQKSDVFSYGITVWEIFSNAAEPYENLPNSEVKNKVLEGHRLRFPPVVPAELVELISKHCWAKEPRMRCSMKQVVHELENILLRYQLWQMSFNNVNKKSKRLHRSTDKVSSSKVASESSSTMQIIKRNPVAPGRRRQTSTIKRESRAQKMRSRERSYETRKIPLRKQRTFRKH